MEIVKKLSIGKLIGAFRAMLPDADPLELGKVVGIVRGTKVGESQFGLWTALTGDFVFVPSIGDKAGMQFRSGVLFVPDVVLDLVVPIAEGLGKGEAAEIAFSLSARRDDTASVGYAYTAAFLREPQNNDPLTALVQLALPAPAEPEKKAPNKATEKA